MGLLLSILVACVGVVELLDFYYNVRRNFTLIYCDGVDLQSIRQKYVEEFETKRKGFQNDSTFPSCTRESQQICNGAAGECSFLPHHVERPLITTFKSSSGEDIELEFKESVIQSRLRSSSPRKFLLTEKQGNTRSGSPRKFIVEEEPHDITQSEKSSHLPEYLLSEQRSRESSPTRLFIVKDQENNSSVFPLPGQFVITEGEKVEIQVQNCEPSSSRSDIFEGSENIGYKNKEYQQYCLEYEEECFHRSPSPYPRSEVTFSRNSNHHDLLNSVQEVDEESHIPKSSPSEKIDIILDRKDVNTTTFTTNRVLVTHPHRSSTTINLEDSQNDNQDLSKQHEFVSQIKTDNVPDDNNNTLDACVVTPKQENLSRQNSYDTAQDFSRHNVLTSDGTSPNKIEIVMKWDETTELQQHSNNYSKVSISNGTAKAKELQQASIECEESKVNEHSSYEKDSLPEFKFGAKDNSTDKPREQSPQNFDNKSSSNKNENLKSTVSTSDGAQNEVLSNQSEWSEVTDLKQDDRSFDKASSLSVRNEFGATDICQQKIIFNDEKVESGKVSDSNNFEDNVPSTSQSYDGKVQPEETSGNCGDKTAKDGGGRNTAEPFWLIFSGEYTKAMNKDWHGQHFCCWQCDESLTGQRYVLRDDHPYCVSCYESVFANACEKCSRTIGIDSKDLSYKDKHWHEACFLCTSCGQSLVDKQFGSKGDRIYCGRCYDEQFASRCDGCHEIFRAGTKKMEYKTRQWHEKCFCCCVCKVPIGTQSFIPREQEIYCAKCYEEKFATRCIKCNKVITSGGVTYKNEPWHRECFTCTNCSKSLAGERFTSRDEKPYCAECFGELFAKRCFACNKPITGIGGTKFISFEDRHWHNDCFFCAHCRTSLVGRGFITDEQDIICPECAKQKLL